MGNAEKDLADRVLDVIGAWEQKCPRKTFYSYTLEQFKARAQPFLTARERIASLESQTTHAVSDLETEARTLRPEIRGVVNAVMGDREEGGENGALYAAMGFIPRAKRATGLVRRRTARKPTEVSS